MLCLSVVFSQLLSGFAGTETVDSVLGWTHLFSRSLFVFSGARVSVLGWSVFSSLFLLGLTGVEAALSVTEATLGPAVSVVMPSLVRSALFPSQLLVRSVLRPFLCRSVTALPRLLVVVDLVLLQLLFFSRSPSDPPQLLPTTDPTASL